MWKDENMGERKVDSESWNYKVAVSVLELHVFGHIQCALRVVRRD